jgi:hypothetical protein
MHNAQWGFTIKTSRPVLLDQEFRETSTNRARIHGFFEGVSKAV